MRDALAGWVLGELGSPLQRCRPVGGGSIHAAWDLQLADGRRLFAKTNAAVRLPLLEAEAEGLKALAAAAAGELAVPRPHHCGRFGEHALLLLDWLDLSTGGAEADWAALGAALARLHRRSLQQGSPAFGWSHDNHIGSAPQRNGWSDDWGRFFAERRLGVQLALAAVAGRRLHGASELLSRAPGWLNGHGAQPCLVHGDLWGGNAALLLSPIRPSGPVGALFDPAIHRGDREVDLAMARLFGGFPDPFFAGYAAEWPLPDGHQRRRACYDLYHLLNHANLFGGGYWGQAQAVIDALLA